MSRKIHLTPLRDPLPPWCPCGRTKAKLAVLPSIVASISCSSPPTVRSDNAFPSPSSCLSSPTSTPPTHALPPPPLVPHVDAPRPSPVLSLASSVSDGIHAPQIVEECATMVDVKRGLRVGSRNVFGFHAVKRMEMGELAVRLKLDIVAIQETMETSRCDSVECPRGFVWIGKARKEEATADASGPKKKASGGVGFLVRDTIVDQVRVLQGVHEDSLWLRVDGGSRGRDLIVASVYLPHNGHSNSSKDEGWCNFREDLDRFQGLGRVVLLGDFNAWVGRGSSVDDSIGMWGEERTNNNGGRLKRLLEETGLVAINNRVEEMGVQFTRRDKVHGPSCTDFIIVERGELERVSGMKVDETDIVSDHFLLWTELRGVGRPQAKVKDKIIFKWRMEQLCDANVRRKYEVELWKVLGGDEGGGCGGQGGAQIEIQECRGFVGGADLAERETCRDVDDAWRAWKEALEKVALEVVGKKKIVVGRAVKWWCKELKEIIGLRREAYKVWRISGSDEDAAVYRRRRKEAKNLVMEKRREEWGRTLESINSEESNPKTFWSLINRVKKGKARSGVQSMKNEEGLATSNKAEIVDIFRRHYERLGQEGVAQGSEVEESFRREVEGKVDECLRGSEVSEGGLDAGIDEDEVRTAINELPNGKAAPGLPNEFLKGGGEAVVKSLHRLFNLMWAQRSVPKEWGVGVIVSLFKKGDKEDPGNYRGITLLGAVRKLFCRVINNRLMAFLDKRKLHEGQAGFRPGRSCEDHIFALSQIVQGRRRSDLPTYAFFLDLKKAYDSVWRTGLWFKLAAMGVKGTMLKVLISLYSASRCKALVEGVESSEFLISKGVAQGCPLSCTLFDAFVNDLLTELEGAGFGVECGTRLVQAMMFADDFVGLESSGERLQKLINVIEKWCGKWGLEANVSKCAVVVFNGSDKMRKVEWKWGGEALPVQSSYTYLGVVFHESCKWSANLESMVEKGSKSLNNYAHVLKSKQLTVRVRLALLTRAILPTVEYAGGVWEPTKGVDEELERVQLKGAKSILQCCRTTPSVAVRGDLGLDLLRTRRDLAKLVWWHKISRMGEERFPRMVMECTWRKVKLGADVKSWGKVVEGLFKDLQLDKGEMLDLGESQFRAIVESRLLERDAHRVKVLEGRKNCAYVGMSDCRGLQPYLLGPYTLGRKLKFKFRSGSHGLQEEVGRRRGVDRSERTCDLCTLGVESVSHFLWECPMYADHRSKFLAALESILGTSDFARLPRELDEKSRIIMSHKVWGGKGEEVDRCVSQYLMNAWIARCNKLHGEKSVYWGRRGEDESQRENFKKLRAPSREGREVYGKISSDAHACP
eukprot:TRINITY_DN1401_c0_g1_i9.p1 TRINITY_DN1401_c0_g1~~TRINITY_DN1401_c0_g1_i9.p1  ORF type:complete len:1328 (-),score=159.78 TRINITY_DN1401_c0_g1_i9:667-4650(-)